MRYTPRERVSSVIRRAAGMASRFSLFLEGQPEKLLEHLTCEKTFIMFTEEQAADAHVQVGAMRFTVARIGDWLDTTFA